MKTRLAAASFVVAVVLTFVGLLLPPTGEIAGNVLIAIGQFLILCATLLGVDSYVDQIKHLYHK